ERIRLPARARDNDVPCLVVREIRLYDRAGGGAFHDLSDFDRLRVRSRGTHAAAHVWVKGEIDRAQQHLAWAGLGNSGLDQLEVVWRRLAARARGEKDLAVLFRCHGPSLSTPVESPDLLARFSFMHLLAARSSRLPVWSLTSHST